MKKIKSRFRIGLVSNEIFKNGFVIVAWEKYVSRTTKSLKDVVWFSFILNMVMKKYQCWQTSERPLRIWVAKHSKKMCTPRPPEVFLTSRRVRPCRIYMNSWNDSAKNKMKNQMVNREFDFQMLARGKWTSGKTNAVIVRTLKNKYICV